MNRLALLLIFITCLNLQSQSQVNEEEINGSYSLGISSGIGSMVVRDQVLSTYRYKGFYVPLGLHFESRKTNRKASFNLGFFNKPTLKTKTNEGFEYKGDLGEFFPTSKDGLDISTLKSTFWSLNYTQLFLINKNRESRLKVFMGFDMNLLKMEKQFLQFVYVSKLTDRIYNLGYVLGLERNFNLKHQLTYQLSLPVLSNIKRSLYNSDADPATTSETKTTSFGGCFGLQSIVGYQFKLSQLLGIKASYTFSYMEVNFPEREQWSYDQGSVGVFFHF